MMLYSRDVNGHAAMELRFPDVGARFDPDTMELDPECQGPGTIVRALVQPSVWADNKVIAKARVWTQLAYASGDEPTSVRVLEIQ